TRSALVRGGQVLLTFYLIVVGRVIYRSSDLGSAWDILRAMHSPVRSSPWTFSAFTGLLVTVLGIIASHLISYLTQTAPRLGKRPLVLWPATVMVAMVAVLLGNPHEAFFYGQQ